MRSKLLIMSSAALLAGTLAAAGQSIQPGGATQEKGQQGSSQGAKSNEGAREQKGPQAQGRQGQAQPDQDKAKSQTQGQAPREQERQGQTPQGQTQRDQGRTNQQGAREGERGGNASESFTTEQRTKIRETVLKEKNAPRVGKVDFSIKEGTVVPRTMRVVEIPDVIVEIHPEWRGFKYFIVNEELVIVEPDTLRIVAVLDV